MNDQGTSLALEEKKLEHDRKLRELESRHGLIKTIVTTLVGGVTAALITGIVNWGVKERELEEARLLSSRAAVNEMVKVALSSGIEARVALAEYYATVTADEAERGRWSAYHGLVATTLALETEKRATVDDLKQKAGAEQDEKLALEAELEKLQAELRRAEANANGAAIAKKVEAKTEQLVRARQKAEEQAQMLKAARVELEQVTALTAPLLRAPDVFRITRITARKTQGNLVVGGCDRISVDTAQGEKLWGPRTVCAGKTLEVGIDLPVGLAVVDLVENDNFGAHDVLRTLELSSAPGEHEVKIEGTGSGKSWDYSVFYIHLPSRR